MSEKDLRLVCAVKTSYQSEPYTVLKDNLQALHFTDERVEEMMWWFSKYSGQ